MSETERHEGFKEKLSGDLNERYPQLLKVLDDALESKRKVWADFKCKDCGRHQRQLVEIQDVDSAMKAASFLADHGHGKPGTATAGDNERISFVRRVVMSDAGETIRKVAELWGAEKAAELEQALSVEGSYPAS